MRSVNNELLAVNFAFPTCTYSFVTITLLSTVVIIMMKKSYVEMLYHQEDDVVVENVLNSKC